MGKNATKQKRTTMNARMEIQERNRTGRGCDGCDGERCLGRLNLSWVASSDGETAFRREKGSSRNTATKS